MTDRELFKMALDALEAHADIGINATKQTEALRARLAQPEPEPIAYLCENAVGHKYFRWKKPPSTYKPIALYTAPPQREWVETFKIETNARQEVVRDIAAVFLGFGTERERWLEDMLKEKNGEK